MITLDPNYRPHAVPLSQSYKKAIKELALPYPSDRLPDWECFNKVTGGFRAREFSILCGPTGKGKTALLANWSAQFMKAKIPHFVASVETGDTDFVKRVMSVRLGRDLNTGDPVPSDILTGFHSKFGQDFVTENAWLSLHDSRIELEELTQELFYMATVNKCRVAIIDNLNFILNVTRAADQVIEMDRVIHGLIEFCKQVDLHVIMVAHPKKTDDGRVTDEFDIKGSSTAVQEAHNVFLFNPPEKRLIDESRADWRDREITFQKLRRRGPNQGARLLLKYIDGTYVEKGFV